MQRVLITGGSGGIGSAIARACAAHGLWPVVGYARNQQQASNTVRSCGTGETAHLDLLADTWNLDPLSNVSAVVHCAGLYTQQRTLLGSNPPEVAQLLEVNALAPLRLTESLLNRGAPMRHCLFLLSSAMWCRGGGPYALSKAAALATCKLLSRELAPAGVQVHAIMPGWTETPMAQAAAIASGRSLDDVRQGHPQSRILEPDEIGQLAVELLLDKHTHTESQLILWDQRDGPEPIWTPLETALSLSANAV